jgi:hypothetical protein
MLKVLQQSIMDTLNLAQFEGYRRFLFRNDLERVLIRTQAFWIHNTVTNSVAVSG